MPDNTAQGDSFSPERYTDKLQEWLKAQADWHPLDQNQHSSEEVANAVATADRLAVTAKTCKPEELSPVMQQLLQLMQEMHVSSEQLTLAESSLHDQRQQLAKLYTADAGSALLCQAQLYVKFKVLIMSGLGRFVTCTLMQRLCKTLRLVKLLIHA